jgi:SAM-dependent methyltransferase
MQECVPFFLEDAQHPQIRQAREHQAAMVAHITDGPDAYAAYYQANAHERPFEEQYETQPQDAHKVLPRVAVLRDRLGQLEKDRVRPIDGHLPVLLDCACNDGWMGVNLRGIVDYHGIDLNPGCVDRAKARHVRRGQFRAGDIHQATDLTAGFRPEGGYDYVVCFECLEHVPDPDATMAALVSVTKPGGRIFLSTPAGATEHGDLPTWWLVEPKGHVRVFTPTSFQQLLARYGTVEGILLGPDQVMVAELRLG